MGKRLLENLTTKSSWQFLRFPHYFFHFFCVLLSPCSSELDTYTYKIGYLFQSARFSPIFKISDLVGAHFKAKTSSFRFTTGYQTITATPGAVFMESGTICKICQLFASFENLKNRRQYLVSPPSPPLESFP